MSILLQTVPPPQCPNLGAVLGQLDAKKLGERDDACSAAGLVAVGVPLQAEEEALRVINADLGEHGVSLPSVRSDGLGIANSAPTTQLLQAYGTNNLGWSLFGYRANINVDGFCGQGTRDHYDAYAPGGASCWVNRWNTDSPYDCTINLHYGISGGHTDTCNWSVYTNL